MIAEGQATAGAALLARLEGRWRLMRQIEDRKAGIIGQLVGDAVFEPDGSGVLYNETGTLTLPGQPPLRAERRDVWRADRSEVRVFFEDGRFFHAFDARSSEAASDHECSPDRYDVRYAFNLPSGWSSIWEVRGPRKDYRMESHYSPL